MDPRTTTRRGLLALGASAAMGGAAALAQETAKAPLVVYAVRHAEKAGEGRDPELSDAGKARAAELARVLADVKLDAIYSTPLQRTRTTAAPLAKAKGLEVKDYRPGGLAAQLKAGEARTVLVVGHSNTTPALVRALGAEYGTKVLGGYDDLFLAVALPGGATVFQHLHYGAESTDSGH